MIALKEKEKQNIQNPSLLSLLLLVLLACTAAVAFRRSSGVWMILPIYPLCIAAASFLPVKRVMRAVFFLVLTAVLNMVESTDTLDLAILCGIAAACFLLVELAVSLFRKKQAVPCIIGAAVLLVYLGVSSLFIGNPFSALTADSKLNDYIEETYVTATGTHQFDAIRYDRKSALYTVKATNEAYPTESREITLMGDHIADRYRDMLEDQEMREQALAITEILREAFPKDSFTVLRLGIDGFARGLQAYSTENTTDYRDRMDFCIQLSGKPTYEKLLNAAVQYNEVLVSSGVQYDDLVFTGGEGLRFRMEISPQKANGIFREEMTVSVYVLRHPEHYSRWKQSEIFGFLDRKIGVHLNRYE